MLLLYYNLLESFVVILFYPSTYRYLIFLDFKELSVIDIELGQKFFVEKIEKIIINSAISEDLDIKKIVDFHLGRLIIINV